MMINWSLYPNFSESEFTCHCGCGGTKMKPAFLSALQNLRGTLGFPLIISSGYRCPKYNNQVSSTGRDGPHTKGRAADILVNGTKAYDLIRYAIEDALFLGVGISQKGAFKSRFIHLDDLSEDDGFPRPWVWSY